MVDRLRAQCVEAPGAFAAFGEQSGAFEQTQMLADCLLCDVEMGTNLAGGKLRAAHEPKYVAPARVGQGAQGRIRTRGVPRVVISGGAYDAHHVRVRLRAKS